MTELTELKERLNSIERELVFIRSEIETNFEIQNANNGIMYNLFKTKQLEAAEMEAVPHEHRRRLADKPHEYD